MKESETLTACPFAGSAIVVSISKSKRCSKFDRSHPPPPSSPPLHSTSSRHRAATSSSTATSRPQVKRNVVTASPPGAKKSRYPSFSHVKCRVPSHIVKAQRRPTVAPKASGRSYPTFEHITHKIDDECRQQRPKAKRLHETYVRLNSYSKVSSTIPKAEPRRAWPENSGQPADQSTESQMQQALAASTSTGSTVSDADGVRKWPQGAMMRVLRPRNHMLSELQRRRIAEIFKGGSRLLKMPFPFLLVYASYDQRSCAELGEQRGHR
ncbi:hypothetical protein V9T40_011542 [Parthenolecanium corni]|uniref:Uncharacterized protein n=1 Tax=Parthenolecanium corni TaxID=536013 RepID=A0AAN9TKQ1_9HEMI